MPVVTDGRRGTGVEAYGSNYPFVTPSDDVRGLLADFYLSHAVRAAVPPLRVSWLHGFCRAQSSCASDGLAPSDSPDPVHEADLVVKDADGAVVFDSTEAGYFQARNWGARFRLYEWRTATAVCRALAHAGANDAEDVVVFATEITPENGVLDERAYDLVPDRVTSVEVNGEVFTGHVEFVQGYNLVLDRSAPLGKSRRARARVNLVADPGGGEGRFPSCVEPEQVVRRINGVGPTARGDFTLSALGCYWLERPVTAQAAVATVAPASLRLNNNCGPCCECADYENTYHGVRRLYDRFKALGRRGEEVRGLFKENIDRWLTERACRRASPTRVTGAVGPGGYLGVAASFCNTDDDCKYRVDLVLTFVHNNGKEGALVPCATVVSLTGGGTERKEPYGSWNEWGNFWEALNPGRAVRINTRLRFADVAEGDSVTVTATPYLDGTPQPAAETTLALSPCGG